MSHAYPAIPPRVFPSANALGGGTATPDPVPYSSEDRTAHGTADRVSVGIH